MMLYPLLRAAAPYLLGFAVLAGTYFYGSSTTATKYDKQIAAADAARQAAATEAHRRDELQATNAKDTYDQATKTITARAAMLNDAVQQLRMAAPSATGCGAVPAGTAGTASAAPAPQLNWSN